MLQLQPHTQKQHRNSYELEQAHRTHREQATPSAPAPPHVWRSCKWKFEAVGNILPCSSFSLKQDGITLLPAQHWLHHLQGQLAFQDVCLWGWLQFSWYNSLLLGIQQLYLNRNWCGQHDFRYTSTTDFLNYHFTKNCVPVQQLLISPTATPAFCWKRRQNSGLSY